MSTTTLPPKTGATVQVGIGELHVAEPPTILRTVLGSCVGIAVYDPARKIGGLAHAILPEGHEEAQQLGKFADQAVDNLVVALLGRGSDRGRLKSKLVGGADMFGKQNAESLGERNVAAARKRLEQHKIPVLAEASGGNKGRRMILNPENGQVSVEIIGGAKETI